MIRKYGVDLVVLVLFVVSVWRTLSYAPLDLDDHTLLASFEHAGFWEIWGFDHYGHLRPVKNLYFWLLAQRPALLTTLRALNVLAALGCAWLVRSLWQLDATPSTAVASHAPRRPKPEAGTGGVAPHALWLLNPTTVAGVAWLSASNYLFALLGSLIYVHALERDKPQRVIAHSALLFAALSHELALLTPLWLLLRSRRDARARLLGAAAVWALPIALRLLHTAPVMAYRSQLPPLQLVASAAYNFGLNLRLWLWPQGSFGVLLTQTAPLPVAWCVGSWLAAVALGVLLWRTAPRAALLWIVLFLAPLVNLVPIGNTPVALHYLIIPGVGLAWLAAWALGRFERPALTLTLTAALLVAWQPAFRQSVRAFESELALYELSAQHYPDNIEVRVNLIAANLNAGRMARVQSLLDESLQRAPEHPGLRKNQLVFFVQTQRLDAALQWFEHNTALVAEEPGLLLHKGLVLQRLGRVREAEPVFGAVLERAKEAPVRAVAGYQLANLYVQAGRLRDARALLQTLHDEQPEHPDITRALNLIDDALR